MTRVRRMAVTALGGAMVIGSSLSAPPAQAVPAQSTDLPPQRYTITLVEVPNCVSPGVDCVTATGDGLLDLTPLNLLFFDAFTTAAIGPAGGTIITGPTGQDQVNIFSGPITGPTSFGSGALATPNQGSGDTVGIAFGHTAGGSNMDFLIVPGGFPISGQVDFSNTSEFDTLGTFSSLGAQQEASLAWSRQPNRGGMIRLVVVRGGLGVHAPAASPDELSAASWARNRKMACSGGGIWLHEASSSASLAALIALRGSYGPYKR